MAEKNISVRLRALTDDYTRALADAARKTRQYMGEIEKSAAKNSEGFTTLGLGVTAAGAAMTAGLGMAARSAIEFESSFAGVRKTVDGTETQLTLLSEGFRAMAREIPVSVNELNRIGEAAGQLGIHTDAILGFTRVAADLGMTTNMSAESAATALARLANITQMPQDEFDRLGSTLVDLGNKSAATESEIVDMALRIAGAGAQVGLAESEILAMATALSSVGIEAEAGGSSISRVMIELASAVASGGDDLTQFAAVAGMSGSEFAAAFKTDAAAAITDFIEGLGQISEQGSNVFGVLEELGLQEIRVRDALLRASGAGDLFRESLENAERAWKENNALTEEAQRRYETVASKLVFAQNAVKDFAIEIGNVLLPAVAFVAEKGTDLMQFFSDLPGPLKVAGTVVGLLAGGIALLGGGFLLLVPRIAATKAALVDLNITAATTRSALSGVVGVMGGPWGAAVVGATAAVGLFAASQTTARRETEALTEAIVANSGALDENLRKQVAQQLESNGEFLTKAARFGIGGSTLVDAVLGEEGDIERVITVLNTVEDEYAAFMDRIVSGSPLTAAEQERWDWLRANIDEAGALRAKVLNMSAASEKAFAAQRMVNAAAGDGAKATAEYGDALDQLRGVASGAVGSIEDLTDAVFGLADAEQRVLDSEFSLIDAREELNDLLREGAVDEEAVADARERVADATRRVDDAERSLLKARERLNDLLNPSATDAEDLAVRRARAEQEILDAERHLSAVRAAGSSPNAIAEAELKLREERLKLAEIDEEAAGRAEEVEDARLAVADAERDLTDAQRDAKKAGEELATAMKGDEDWSRKVEKAKRDVESAERDVISALLDSDAAFTTHKDLLGQSAANAAALRDRLDELATRYPQHAGIIGELAAGLPTSSTPTRNPDLLRIDGARAGGGSVWPGGTFLVGENQPEILEIGPGGFGRVYPSVDAYRGSTTQAPTTTTFNRNSNWTAHNEQSIGAINFNGVDPARWQSEARRRQRKSNMARRG